MCKRIKGTGSYAVQTKRRCQKMRESSMEKWWEGEEGGRGGGSNAALCGIEMKMSSVARLFLPDA